VTPPDEGRAQAERVAEGLKDAAVEHMVEFLEASVTTMAGYKWIITIHNADKLETEVRKFEL
jgi:hypothetical protein